MCKKQQQGLPDKGVLGQTHGVRSTRAGSTEHELLGMGSTGEEGAGGACDAEGRRREERRGEERRCLDSGASGPCLPRRVFGRPGPQRLPLRRRRLRDDGLGGRGGTDGEPRGAGDGDGDGDGMAGGKSVGGERNAVGIEQVAGKCAFVDEAIYAGGRRRG